MNKQTADQVKAALVRYFTEKYNGDVPDFFMADHNHEELPEGSWSIAAEGWYADEEMWAYCVPLGADAPEYLKVPGVYIERLYGWCLALYDNNDNDND